MAEKKESGTGKPRARPGRKARPVTLDLEATEVGSAAGKTSADSKPAEKKADDGGKPEPGKGASVSGAAAKSAEQKTGSKPAAQSEKSNNSKPQDKSAAKSDESRTTSGDARRHAAAAGEEKQVRRSGSVFTAVVSAVIGGVVALAGLLALAAAGQLSWLTAGQDEAVQTRISAVEQSLQTMRQDIAGNRQAIDGVAGSVDSAVASAGAADQERLSKLEAGVEAIRTSLDSVGQAESTPEVTGLLTGINERLDGLESRLEAVSASRSSGSDGSAALAPALERLNEVEAAVRQIRASVESLGQAANGQDVADRVAGLASRLETVEGRLEAQQEEANARSESSGGDEDASSETSLAAAMAMASLERALNSGQPFERELQIVSALMPDAPQLQELRTIASTGAPRLADLTASFDETADEIIAASRAENSDGVLDRLWARAQSIVSVRPVGHVEGDGVAQTVARAEARLKDGDAAAAVRELETLDGAAAARAGDWLERARTYVEAQAQLSAFNAQILSSLGGTGEGAAQEPAEQ